ncbi:MarR family transcriptional regulator [Mesorhizobium sp. WSM3860]|uniref:MarR family winged helix-turn-helix transcriptional regulator n=1 Tax=Mesorhizobium sp. WSM3860 TaxID=2029403 RepID=UPI000BAF7A6E|nr:MarR family transcriptional regulator [Mesorhizobium sp. WSM3860]PBC01905.1 MarR family transcriptional regulator [Mesorhizobium sp. WSM3860]
MKIDLDENPELMERLTLDVMPCFAIYSAANAVNRFYRKMLEELDLTYPQYLVMVVLWETRGTTMKSLGERLDLDSSTLTPLVKKLESRGLVTRARSKADERVLDVVPTAAGMAMRKAGCEAALAMTVHSGETFETQAQLRERIMRVRDGLNAA